MNHPEAIRPQAHAEFNPEKMGKTTIFESERILVGLNAFQPGQAHHLHAHAGQDKVYHVLEGRGLFLLEDREIEMEAGLLLVAPEGVPHGIRNTSDGRLIVRRHGTSTSLALTYPSRSTSVNLRGVKAP